MLKNSNWLILELIAREANDYDFTDYGFIWESTVVWKTLQYGNTSWVHITLLFTVHSYLYYLTHFYGLVQKFWILWASLVAQRLKSLPGMQETRVQTLGRKIPWRRKWQPTPVLLPGESHGGRSLVGYSPWGCRVGHDWATSLSLSFTFMLTSHKN